MELSYHVMSSPVGLLFLARTRAGLRYLEFMDRKSLKRMIANHAEANPDASWRPSLFDLKSIVDELEGYFNGARTAFNMPLDPIGTEFQLKVWTALCRIPYGETRTYGEVAARIGQPRATRAVGLANNQNPIAIVIPCHRVIGADGSLTGYGGGMTRKRWLLDNEARFAQPVGRTGDLFARPGSFAHKPAATKTPASAALIAKSAAPKPAAATKPTAVARTVAATKPTTMTKPAATTRGIASKSGGAARTVTGRIAAKGSTAIKITASKSSKRSAGRAAASSRRGGSGTRSATSMRTAGRRTAR